MAKKPSNIPKDETKEAKFVRLVQPRVKRAIRSLRSVGKCAGPGYGFTTEQATQIMEALVGEVRRVQKAFEGSVDAEAEFVLQ